jgi:hypothetical protein
VSNEANLLPEIQTPYQSGPFGTAGNYWETGASSTGWDAPYYGNDFGQQPVESYHNYTEVKYPLYEESQSQSVDYPDPLYWSGVPNTDFVVRPVSDHEVHNQEEWTSEPLIDPVVHVLSLARLR